MNPREWLRRQVLPEWTRDASPDHQHPHRRRFTRGYLRKKGIVKNLWIGSGFLMILLATPALTLAIAMVATFLSFMILDETA